MRSLSCVAIVAIAMGSSTGCIELAALLTGSPLDQGSGAVPDDNGIDMPDDGMSSEVPQVTLAVSNSSPSTNEEVTLSCRTVFGSAPASIFAFQPSSVLIDINQAAGTAVFLPSESVVGTAFTFTCTATNGAGTSDPSQPLTVIPVGGLSGA